MQITATFESIGEMKDFVEAMGTGFTQTKPVQQAVPVQATPVQTAPVQTAPAQTASVQAAPVQTAPVQQPQPVPTQQPASVTGAVPTSSPSYTVDELANAAMALMDSGKQGDLIGLLGQFGVNALPDLQPEQYGAFATALRGMGAQI